jgi:hypothetical protein
MILANYGEVGETLKTVFLGSESFLVESDLKHWADGIPSVACSKACAVRMSASDLGDKRRGLNG